MGRLGFEPRTNRLKAEYSTVELATREEHEVFIFFTSTFLFARILIVTQLFQKIIKN